MNPVIRWIKISRIVFGSQGHAQSWLSIDCEVPLEFENDLSWYQEWVNERYHGWELIGIYGKHECCQFGIPFDLLKYED